MKKIVRANVYLQFTIHRNLVVVSQYYKTDTLHNSATEG